MTPTGCVRGSRRSASSTPRHVALFENEKRLTVAGRAVELSVMMLHRGGFEDVKGQAWVERDRQVIEAGLVAYDRATAYQRG